MLPSTSGDADKNSFTDAKSPGSVASPASDSTGSLKATKSVASIQENLPPTTYVGPEQKAYPLYPASKAYVDGKEPYYVEPFISLPHPSSEIFTKKSNTTTEYQDAQACMFTVNNLFREWRPALLKVNSQDTERAKHFSLAIGEVLLTGVERFHKKVLDFLSESLSLNVKDFNEQFLYLSNTLRELALTAHPPLDQNTYEKMIDNIWGAELAEKLQQANNFLEGLESIARRSNWLKEETIQACEERTQCFHGPKEATKQLLILEDAIQKTDFSKTKGILFLASIDDKFSEFKTELASLQAEIEGDLQFGAIGYAECKQQLLKISLLLEEKVKPHIEKLSKDGKQKFKDLQERNLKDTGRERAATLPSQDADEKKDQE